MESDVQKKRRILSWVLSVSFLLALVMGPGPGIYLVNPDPSGDGARATFLGMPVVYAWALFWYAVMAVIVLTAYFKLWNDDKPSS